MQYQVARILCGRAAHYSCCCYRQNQKLPPPPPPPPRLLLHHDYYHCCYYYYYYYHHYYHHQYYHYHYYFYSSSPLLLPLPLPQLPPVPLLLLVVVLVLLQAMKCSITAWIGGASGVSACRCAAHTLHRFTPTFSIADLCSVVVTLRRDTHSHMRDPVVCRGGLLKSSKGQDPENVHLLAELLLLLTDTSCSS